MNLWCSKKEKFFKFFFSDVYVRIMIENEIYCDVNGFLKWNISKKTSYIVGNKTFTGKICILNLRNKKKKSVLARVWSSSTTGQRRSQRKRVRSLLKIPLDERIGWSLANLPLEEILYILGVPWKQTEAEPEGYNLSYTFLFEKFFVWT